MSTLHDATVAAVAAAANDIGYGVAINGRALEWIEQAALATPNQDIVAGPIALASATQIAGWLARYNWAAGFIGRAKANVGNPASTLQAPAVT